MSQNTIKQHGKYDKVKQFAKLAAQKLGVVFFDSEDEEEEPDFHYEPAPKRQRRGDRERDYERDQWREERPARRDPSVYEQNYARQKHPGEESAAPRVREGRQIAKKADATVYYISSIQRCSDVINLLIAGTSVVVYFDNVDRNMAQRLIDTLSGAAFALNAKVRKIVPDAYLIAPKNVNIDVVQPVKRRY